ncbi:hypothetical protein JR316_0008833 [Psilocybe cubensis]|uniref:Uncharacterized protein n=1 Tax=Psilocybe cubensis TaxID=181762 RepID=A0ACB8GSD5_PSICU|nr:hypothetical protein JR316_0008833 [Psilocybe cubensis]KAH9478379.1 hypothetical protein JR316_0008833 [Psilocybe cubensis]
MPPTRSKTEYERRPTLPSIHTLNLPMLSGSGSARPLTPPNVQHENYDQSNNSHKFVPRHSRNFSTSSSTTNDSREASPVLQHARNFSTSSTATNESRNFSPVPFDPSANPRNPFASGKPVRVRACSIDEADAIFLVKSHSSLVPARSGPPFSEPHILLFGNTIQQFRNGSITIAKGTRVHPYRVVRRPSPSNGRVPSVVIHPIAPPRRL